MTYRNRWLESSLSSPASQGKVRLLFGARQTGKSTLLERVMAEAKSRTFFNLQDSSLRQAFERRPHSFSEALLAKPGTGHAVLVDEIQKVPALLEEIQWLHDRHPRRFEFLLTGSSARRLRASSANLLPGRSHLFHLFPITQPERGARARVLPLPMESADSFFPARSLHDLLLLGSLPGVSLEPAESAVRSLETYSQVYIEEEIRREGMVRDLGAFGRFLELAAVSSGKTINLVKLSNESGVAKATIRDYYHVLVDTFVGDWLEPFVRSHRKRLLTTPKFFFFDLGVRNAAARLALDDNLLAIQGGDLLEHWVGLELMHRARMLGRAYRVGFWRTVGGAEVDFVLRTPQEVVPIEVKWTGNPTLRDARHILRFFDDHPDARQGYVVCRVSEPRQLHERVTAIPWSEL